MKTPSTWEELPASLKEDTEDYIRSRSLPPTDANLLKTLIRIAFYEGATFGVEQVQARLKA